MLAIEDTTDTPINIVGGWWVFKTNKVGKHNKNGNFNFSIASQVKHKWVVTYQATFLSILKVSAMVSANNWVWGNLCKCPTMDTEGNVASADILLWEL